MKLHFATNTISATRDITHDGRQYLVAPVVAVREGILNDTLVLAAEFGAYVEAWNGKACPIGHPKRNGEYISANSPDVWALEVPGHLWNASLDSDKLKGEIWIDLERAKKIGKRALAVVSKLRANEPVEVSTGYFSDLEETSGIWNGHAYSGIARNIRPDHLALLPDEVGACSWDDGCGTPRVNVRDEMNTNDGTTPTVSTDGTTVSTNGTVFIDATNVPIANSVEERSLFERFRNWLGQHKIEGISVQETQDMKKCDLVAALTANTRCKFSKEKLDGWEEADLQALQESLSANEDPTPPAPEPEPTPPTPPPAALPIELTQFAAMLQSLGGVDKLAAALGSITANADQERADLIAGITTNERSAFTEPELTVMSTDSLRKLYGALMPRDYTGAVGIVRNGREPEEFVLAMPQAWPQKEGGK